MESALAQVLAEARQAGAQRVQSIRLRIGELSGVVPDALHFAFEALRTGTAAENAALAIDHVPARFWCARCQKQFHGGQFFSECPDCHCPSGDLREGRELELVSLEVD